MQGQLEHVAQGCVQLSLQNNSPMGGPHSHSEQPLPVPDYPHNNFFCSFSLNYFHLYQLPLVPSLGTTEKRLALSSFLPPSCIYMLR